MEITGAFFSTISITALISLPSGEQTLKPETIVKNKLKFSTIYFLLIKFLKAL
jgi:hypothetical protein